MRALRPITIVFTVGLVLVHAVDRSNFKTCSQSGFCKRQRDHKPQEPFYRVLTDTAETDPSSFKVHLVNKQNGIKLLLEIYALQDSTVRIKINELEPIKQRYEIPVGDVLVQEPQKASLQIESKDSSLVKLKIQDNTLVLHADPFRMDILSADTPVVSLNSRGLLKFEHYRSKDGAAEDNNSDGTEENKEENEDQNEEEQKVEDPDMWEETFKTHQDSKPYGPSSVGIDISFPGFEYVYGIPEHADDLVLKTTKDSDPYRLYNLDVFEYELNNPMALYGSVPYMIAHNQEKTVGVFWQNAAEMWIDISSNTADRGMFSKLVDLVKGDDQIPQVDTHWFSESGIIDVFIMLGPQPKDVFRQYGLLTGTTPLPPLFAIAYHQCRWNYNDENDVAGVDAGFDDHDMPVDVIWLDIEHTDGKRYFTWDAHKFPHPDEMIRNISAKGRKMVSIVDPHVKKDNNYFICQQFLEKDLFIKNKDGNIYDGWCWPGSSYYPDFTDPKVREFWASKFHIDEYKGSTLDLHIWNDMNEPSVFNGPEITMTKDAKHLNGFEHRDVHNIYGLYVHRATYEGLLLRGNNNIRPFVLSRAFFAGSQRYGAVWTGDNKAEWGHLKMSMPMILTLNLVGITQSGADIGGFFNNPEPELLTRWYQAAIYQPFVRSHAHIDTRRREPYLQPGEHKELAREALRTRYRLLPYWYTIFHQNEQTGMPVMRPLWVEFPKEKETYKLDDTFMIGSSLLVRPITDAGATSVTVYLPGQDQVWYDRDTWQIKAGGQQVLIDVDLRKIPVFQRGGSVIPQKTRVRRSSTLMIDDPYTLTIALDKQGNAEGEVYEDDYYSFQYKNGYYIKRLFRFSYKKLISQNLNPEGKLTSKAWIERIIVAGFNNKPTSVLLSTGSGKASELSFNFDPDRKVLTIRKPGVNINTDFTMSIQ